jgi:2-C-methyl-D-erythritol 4-phosphate cytidylyltransferase/2-C-methyl-D-erythritol 2,4-cyclodiphosphate synthase
VRVGVIVVAAGRGSRLGTSLPKQLLEIGGRTMLARSVAAFDGCADVAGLVVVLPAELTTSAPQLIGRTRHPARAVAGGERRQDSVARGLDALPPDVDLVLIHDAARPFADAALIERVIEAAARTGAAVPCLPARDTVKRVHDDRMIVRETLPRERIWLAQTPQGFRRDVLAEAVALGQTGVSATDEAMLAELAGHSVEVVPGDERNMKITTPADLEIAQQRVTRVPRVGTGYDLHRLVPGRPLVLAGVTLAHDLGPLGHSDGDVVCHALTDALLGAAGAGDIGLHFPNTDDRWKGAAGLDLLGRAMEIVSQNGWRAANVDITVILERPKLSPHLLAIRTNLAQTLGLDVAQVSVKGKTNEGVDAVGRGEAIAAHAVAMVAGGVRT